MPKKKIHYMTMLNLVTVGNVLAAFLVIGIVLGTTYYRYMRTDVMNLMRNNVEQAYSYISAYVTAGCDAANTLTTDVELDRAVENYTSDDVARTVEGKKMMDYILQNAMANNPSIENIAIGTAGGMIVKDRYGFDIGKYGSQLREAGWYRELLEGQIAYKFSENIYYDNEYNPGSYYFYATKFKTKFYPTRDQEDRILIVTINTTQMEEYIGGIANNEAVNINVCDGEGKKKLIYQSIPNQEIGDYLTGADLSDRERSRIEKEYAFFEKELPAVSWNIVGSVSRRTLQEMIWRMEPWMLLLIGVVLAMSILTGTLSARVMSRPIKKLSQAMNDMENSKFHGVEEESRCIEIGQLIVTYNEMSSTIQKLIRGIRSGEEQKRRLEFKVLEEQINPHFIYNTLEAVKWVAYVNHSEKIADVIESFVRLLRISLSGGKEMIPVEQEITLVREYAKIMVFRNNYEISLTCDISPDTCGCSTLKLVLQPFVENSFLHAFGTERSGKRIHIRSFLEESFLIFEVCDNGTGFLTERERPDSPEQRKRMTGIGIDNIDRRIKAWHGELYGVRIVSKKGQGTTVTIRQPIIMEETYDTGYDC